MNPAKLDYSPEIDGLRAYAVLAVLLFHAGFTAFSGGFVGVDVFFVISGYLITRLIRHEISRHAGDEIASASVPALPNASRVPAVDVSFDLAAPAPP